MVLYVAQIINDSKLVVCCLTLGGITLKQEFELIRLSHKKILLMISFHLPFMSTLAGLVRRSCNLAVGGFALVSLGSWLVYNNQILL